VRYKFVTYLLTNAVRDTMGITDDSYRTRRPSEVIQGHWGPRGSTEDGHVRLVHRFRDIYSNSYCLKSRNVHTRPHRGRHAKIFGWAKSAAYDRRSTSGLWPTTHNIGIGDKQKSCVMCVKFSKE